MTESDRWARAGALFHELADATEAVREARLEELGRGDAALAAEVRSLLGSDRDSRRLRTGVAIEAVEPDREPGERIGAYRLVGEIARGGMGVVYRAERADGAFDRQVAIKLVRPDLVSPALGAHFLAERRILATLDHPGIAQLLDAGTTEGGQLFLVLELVEGERLDRWNTDRSLPERLDCFLAVCEAVEHAHRKLVLHRDLKPANILVTSDGQPKLLDFGIARLLGEGDAPGEATRLGLRPLTPDYASPEQLRGEPLSTASDVYSLGVVLFELLSGRRPYELAGATSPEERARRIVTGPLPRPSVAARDSGERRAIPAHTLEGDLDAIVGQAIAPESERRYRTVGELAADLRRYLAGRPVAARPASLVDRSKKFVLRHRAAVSAATVVVLVLVASTATALRQAAIAQFERDRAERRFADTRELARSLLFEIHESVRDLDGATQARELIVRRALGYFERLSSEAGDDPALQRELASGYEQVAEIQGAVVQGGSLGLVTSAEGTQRRAVALRQALAARADASWDDRIRLAHALERLAALLVGSGRFAEGRAEAALSLAVAERVNEERPGDLAALDVLAAACQRLGGTRGHEVTQSDRRLLERAVSLRRRLVADAGGELDRKAKLATSLRVLALCTQDFGENERRLLEEAIELQEEVLADGPDSLSARTELIKTLMNYGPAVGVASAEAALAPLTRASDLASTAAAADLANANLRILQMGIEGELAGVFQELGKLDEAQSHLSGQVLLMEEQAREGESAVPFFYAVRTYHALGELLREIAHESEVGSTARRRHLVAARDAYAKARDAGRDRLDDPDADDYTKATHAACGERLAELDRELGGA